MVGYPGNKSKWETPEGKYNRIYDLFMGGGGFTRSALRQSERAIVFGAEANPIQRVVLSGSQDFLSEALEIARKNADTLKLFIDPAWNGLGTYAEKFPHKREFLGVAWAYLVKMPFDAAIKTGDVYLESVAAQVLCSTYGYGANIRVSGNGLNTSPNAQKIRVQTPTLPAPIPQIKSVVSTFERLEIKGGKYAIALIDPPYVLPKRMRKTHKRLTSCYPGHQPYGRKTWDLYWNAISKSLGVNVGTAIVAGYWSEEMDVGIKSLARSYGYSVESILHGGLQQQGNHKHNLVHGNRSQNADLPAPIDTEWRLRKIQKQILVMGQLDLWTV